MIGEIFYSQTEEFDNFNLHIDVNGKLQRSSHDVMRYGLKQVFVLHYFVGKI